MNDHLQLLSLNVEHVINQGMSSLSQKQTLINEVLNQSYEIVLDDGSSGHCLVNIHFHVSISLLIDFKFNQLIL